MSDPMDSHLLSSLPVSGQETPSAASGQALPPNEAGSPASSAGMVVRRAWLLPVYFYKACISPLSQPCCRFYPTCSQYALEAVLKHGVLRGSALAARRLLRCRPGGGCGYDPVP